MSENYILHSQWTEDRYNEYVARRDRAERIAFIYNAVMWTLLAAVIIICAYMEVTFKSRMAAARELGRQDAAREILLEAAAMQIGEAK